MQVAGENHAFVELRRHTTPFQDVELRKAYINEYYFIFNRIYR